MAAIKIKPSLAGTGYADIGLYKYDLKDYKGSIEDCTKSIQSNPNIPEAWFNRALSKRALKLPFCDDMKKAKELGHSKAIEYYPLDCKKTK